MNDIGTHAAGNVRPDNPSPETAPSRSALLIFNPRAGSLTTNSSLDQVVRAARELGWQIELAETEAAGDATRLAASSRHPVVLCAGGDGTLNEVIQGLAGTNTTVGAIPLGTVNVWARELGLSLDPVEATRQLLTGHVRRIDLGRANGRYFLLMAGLGFDAVAIHAIEGTTTKRRFGPLAFLAVGASEALSNRGHRLRLQVDDGETFETNAALVTVGNTRLWAGAVQITNRASAVDGLLDVCIFPGRSLLTKLRHLFLVFIGRHESDPEVTYLQVRRLQVAARPPVPIQVDGEPLGLTPTLIEVVPASLSVLVGSGLAPAVADALDVPKLLSN